MKKTIALLLILSLLVSLCGCQREPPKEEIFNYVRENQAALEALVKNYPTKAALSETKPEKELGLFTMVKDFFYREEGEVLEFYCGGTGNVTNSTYYGFYYSKSDEPHGLEFDHHPLRESSEGVYEWHNSDRSHVVITERILAGWFYYWLKYY